MKWINNLDIDELYMTIRVMELLSALNIGSAPEVQLQCEDHKTDNFCYECEKKYHNCYCRDYDYDYDADYDSWKDSQLENGDKNDVSTKESE